MATVTEPPWLHKAQAIAPRNGTTSHTVSFGFTPAAGSLLVLIVSGGVTHTVAGWTERLQPVNSGELSLFTKTAAGNESGVTITHNGSNYPIGWLVYEFPAGSSWTTGAGSNPTNDTWPAITGLPGAGNPQVVIAARARNTIATDATGSQVWNAPWVEDADLVAAGGATDGTYLTVGHMINVSAASITPSSAATYGSTFVADRQVVGGAFTVAVIVSDVPPNEAQAAGAITWGPGVAGSTRVSRGTAAGSITWTSTATSRTVRKASAVGALHYHGAAHAVRHPHSTAAGQLVWGPGTAQTATADHHATAVGAITWGPGSATATHPAAGGRDITIIALGPPGASVAAGGLQLQPITTSPITAAPAAGPLEQPITVESPTDDNLPTVGTPTVAVAVMSPTAAVTYTPPIR